MDKAIYIKLSEPVQKLVDEIEKHAGFEVEVRHSGQRPKPLIGNAGDGTAGAIPSHESAVIEYDGSLSDVTDEDYAHEVLHLHRHLVQQVPHVYPKNAVDGNAASALENQLEHVIIYEQLLELSDAFKERLPTEAQNTWEQYPWGLTGYNLEFYTLTKYLVTWLYAPADCISLMRKRLSEGKNLYRTRKAAERARKALHDKPKYVRQVFGFAGIRASNFVLRQYRPAERTYSDIAI